MTTIELDTNVTKDKQLIVNHDTTVNGKICRYDKGEPAEFIPIKDLTVEQRLGENLEGETELFGRSVLLCGIYRKEPHTA